MNIPFVNEKLSQYLEDKCYKEYSFLIKAVIADDSKPEAKYNLWCLFMNNQSSNAEIKNLTNRLLNFYQSDTNLDAYINKIVNYNPKLGYISIEASHGKDMKNDFSQDIQIPCGRLDSNYDDVKILEDKIKEVLKMILMESRTICP